MSSMEFIVVKENKFWDMSNLVSNVRWSGRKGAAARSILVNFIDDDGYDHDRTGIDVEKGHQCIFRWKGKELFRGMFMRQEQSRRKMMPVTAYDRGIYLANNEDTFNYKNKTASYIFKDCCDRFEIPYGTIADTAYVIPTLPKPKTTAWDAICDALSQTYKSTGIRYYPPCIGEKIHLLERRLNILQWVIETGVNLEDYILTKSIENIKTRIKLLSKEGVVLAETSDPAIEKKIGIFQSVTQINDQMNTAQLNELVKTTLGENNKPERMLSVTALGLPDVITGVGVFIIIKHLGISKTYYVEEDVHTFQGNYHSMRLKLVTASDIGKPKPAGTPTATEINIGDIVQFAGGSHYGSSDSTTPVGGTRTAGSAKCTNTAKSAIHPYHLIGISSNVYGWVDAGTVSK